MWAFETKVLWKLRRYGKVEFGGISWISLAEYVEKHIIKGNLKKYGIFKINDTFILYYNLKLNKINNS